MVAHVIAVPRVRETGTCRRPSVRSTATAKATAASRTTGILGYQDAAESIGQVHGGAHPVAKYLGPFQPAYMPDPRLQQPPRLPGDLDQGAGQRDDRYSRERSSHQRDHRFAVVQSSVVLHQGPARMPDEPTPHPRRLPGTAAHARPEAPAWLASREQASPAGPRARRTSLQHPRAPWRTRSGLTHPCERVCSRVSQDATDFLQSPLQAPSKGHVQGGRCHSLQATH
jgi:hypothetical protein